MVDDILGEGKYDDIEIKEDKAAKINVESNHNKVIKSQFNPPRIVNKGAHLL